MSYNFIDNSIFDAIYGDGSRGDATITGAELMTTDRFYNNLTITSTGRLSPANYRIYVKEKLEIQAGGIISFNGADATGRLAAGVAFITGTIRGYSRPGGAGGLGGATEQPGEDFFRNMPTQPVTPAASVYTIQGTVGWFSGKGGNSSTLTGSLAQSGSSLAVLGTIYPFVMAARSGWIPNNSASLVSNPVGGGAGGGGGACDAGTASDFGGGGGQGGGVIFIFAKEVVNNGTIIARGGNGANASHATGKAGGGGGGAGGFISLVTRFPTKTGSLDVSGGIGGSGAGGGTSGDNGQSGVVTVGFC